MRVDLPAVLFILTALVAVPPAFALPGDPDQPIDIEADNWDADRSTGVAVYRGNVKVSRGGVEISGDELILRFDGDRLAGATVRGTPVRFSQRHAEGRAPTAAEARELDYDAVTDIVRLQGSARVTVGDDEFTSDDIRYDIGQERIVAGGGEGTRIQVTIQPRTSEEDGDEERPR